MKHAILTYALACVLSLVAAQAAVPGLINYQGRLTDSNGDPVTGSKTLAVAIYDAASGGNLLYSETIGAVTLDANGVYSFQFGSEGDGVAAALVGAAEHWLQLSVDGVQQATRDRVLAVPFAHSAAYAQTSVTTEDSELTTNILLDLQNKVIQLQAGVSSETTPYNLVSDTFIDADGINNMVVTSTTTASYISPAYNAAIVNFDPTKYSVFTNYGPFVRLKTYSAINRAVAYTTVELQYDTRCYVLYNYQDGSSAQTSAQNGPGNTSWLERKFENPQRDKSVASIEIWGSKPSSLGFITTQLKNVKIVLPQEVEVVVDLSSFGRPITAAQLRVDGNRQPGDSIEYVIKNASTSSPTLTLGVKAVLPVSVSQPAKMHIVMTPTQIQDFVFGGTSVNSFSLLLW